MKLRAGSVSKGKSRMFEEAIFDIVNPSGALTTDAKFCGSGAFKTTRHAFGNADNVITSRTGFGF